LRKLWNLCRASRASPVVTGASPVGSLAPPEPCAVVFSGTGVEASAKDPGWLAGNPKL